MKVLLNVNNMGRPHDFERLTPLLGLQEYSADFSERHIVDTVNALEEIKLDVKEEIELLIKVHYEIDYKATTEFLKKIKPKVKYRILNQRLPRFGKYRDMGHLLLETYILVTPDSSLIHEMIMVKLATNGRMAKKIIILDYTGVGNPYENNKRVPEWWCIGTAKNSDDLEKLMKRYTRILTI